MKTPPEEIGKIVAGLTRPQTQAILNPQIMPDGRIQSHRWHVTTLRSLWRKGIIASPLVNVPFTPLGLAVRAALTDRRKG